MSSLHNMNSSLPTDGAYMYDQVVHEVELAWLGVRAMPDVLELYAAMSHISVPGNSRACSYAILKVLNQIPRVNYRSEIRIACEVKWLSDD